ncbi:GAF domain-containing protein [Methanobacterium alcaliphilum]|uniref:GAF domain-containing protein n=1 Tax=Methanobacterium alcaliphilum TaxID=392018 RepID=UPI00200B8B2C|nr:GAF domain-containing protein [Methanobacterium alcaliphilum]MCK9151038.1 GAF domain-containing protein [Methanobacterium alcaliphilum]
MDKTYGIANSVVNDVNQVKKQISDMLPIYSFKEISDVVFEETKRLTNSKYCYVAYVDPENKDSVGISFSHLTSTCQYYAGLGEARFKIRKDGTYGGLLGYSLDTGESFFTHDPKNHPAAHGIPPDHEVVNQFLSVAVKKGKNILGQIVLANSSQDYGREHLYIAEEIAEVYAEVILSKL